MTVSELKKLLSYADDNWDVTMVITTKENIETPWFANIEALKFDRSYGEVRLMD